MVKLLLENKPYEADCVWDGVGTAVLVAGLIQNKSLFGLLKGKGLQVDVSAAVMIPHAEANWCYLCVLVQQDLADWCHSPHPIGFGKCYCNNPPWRRLTSAICLLSQQELADKVLFASSSNRKLTGAVGLLIQQLLTSVIFLLTQQSRVSAAVSILMEKADWCCSSTCPTEMLFTSLSNSWADQCHLPPALTAMPFASSDSNLTYCWHIKHERLTSPPLLGQPIEWIIRRHSSLLENFDSWTNGGKTDARKVAKSTSMQAMSNLSQV
ncbi:hypothetical protein B0H16DRAFT_1454198 [Mycena metata]|uniref:Uncharacterized protein n=1 Tax=Mycena metata TaxID=1033252 RepID=A0AAD7JLV9_9AGAR|nr:hypothetical protein B0H16DRAFT_1454198 [Mycena metata]